MGHKGEVLLAGLQRLGMIKGKKYLIGNFCIGYI
jgi:hypothetical protein